MLGMSLGWATFTEGASRCQIGASAPRFDIRWKTLLTEECNKIELHSLDSGFTGYHGG